jgi:hypothetical protein
METKLLSGRKGTTHNKHSALACLATGKLHFEPNWKLSNFITLLNYAQHLKDASVCLIK